MGFNLFSASRYEYKFGGRRLTIAARPRTTDVPMMQEILSCKCVYAPPVTVRPKVIFDVGAHIGLTSLYFSVMYPCADIYSFEPFPPNHELLRVNAAMNSARIMPVAAGLGGRSGHYLYHMSRDPLNIGGGTFKGLDCDRRKRRSLPIIRSRDFLRREGIGRIDILKIDTEGMEHEIIMDLPRGVIRNISYITGECHGIKDMEVLSYLSRYFYLGFEKSCGEIIFVFKAVNKEIYGTWRKKKS